MISFSSEEMKKTLIPEGKKKFKKNHSEEFRKPIRKKIWEILVKELEIEDPDQKIEVAYNKEINNLLYHKIK